MQKATLAGLALTSLLLMSQASYALPPAYTPPAGLKVIEQGDGLVFVDAKGVALYTYGGDDVKPGKSACNAQCAQQWPPLSAAADAKPEGAWSIIVRDDGARQWAVNGKPLYYYGEDGGPGTTFGDGEGGIWRTAFAPIWSPPGVTISKTLLGSVLADAKGLTLYTRNGDSANKSSCTGSCLENFAPVTAPWLALAEGDWTVITRDDSSKQYAYKGKPVYRSLLDVKSGDTNGDGAGLDEGWRATVLEPAQSAPAWVTLQQSLGGEVLADARGFTLYYHGAPRRSLAATGSTNAKAKAACATATCMGNEWKAVLAEENMKPVGNWTILANEDGTRQWAFKGVRLYINALEDMPAELKGLRFGGDRSWKVMTRSGIPIQNM